MSAEPAAAPDDARWHEAAAVAFPNVEPGSAARLLRDSSEAPDAGTRLDAERRLLHLDWASAGRRPSSAGRPECPHCGRDACDGADCQAARVYTWRELERLSLPARRPLLLGASGTPLLREKDLGMVYAPRGAGKTWLTLGLALAVGSGARFLRWQAPEARPVLYVDGEMPAGSLQDRQRVLEGALRPAGEALVRFLPADLQDEPLPSLVSPEGQARVERHLGGVALVVLDNVSTLLSGLDENDAAAWAPAQAWLLSLRRRGLSVLLAHHANRAGGQRGTSKREDVLDLVLRLSWPPDYQADQGARFEVRFDKARGVSGSDAEPFEAWLRSGEWLVADVATRNYEAAVELFSEGARPGEVAEALGLSRATAFRYQRQARQDGRLAARKGAR